MDDFLKPELRHKIQKLKKKTHELSQFKFVVPPCDSMKRPAMNTVYPFRYIPCSWYIAVLSFPKESPTVHGLWAEGTGGQPNNVNTMETMKREWGFGIMNSQ